MFDFFALATAFVLSSLFCAGILLTERLHAKYSHDRVDADNGQTQHIHQISVPRIGGIGIFLALFIATFFLGHPLLDGKIPFLHYLMYSSIPAIGFGLIEDFTKRVTVAIRLWATIMAGVIACFVFNKSIITIGVPSLDLLLANPFFSICFTAFAVAGVANAINIVDGLNGLAGWVCFYILSVMAALAWSVGDLSFASRICLCIAAVSGFLIFNWPMGKLFLGDGGAYFLGFVIAWLGIFLVQRNPQISPFAILVLCAYPILEVLFSVLRRIIKRMSVGSPDRAHLHQLVYLVLVAKLSPRGLSKRWINSITGWLMSLSVLPCAVLALAFQNNTSALVGCFAALALGYAVLYQLLSSTQAAKADQLGPAQRNSI